MRAKAPLSGAPDRCGSLDAIVAGIQAVLSTAALLWQVAHE